jgi:hypothetical protein
MTLEYFDIEVHDGVSYLDLNDRYVYRATSETLMATTQARNRTVVTSAMYDGEWEVHSTLGNVTENVSIYVNGADQTVVKENIDRVVAAFSQPIYNVRLSIDADVTYWRCFPAEYSIDRSHVYMHNKMAVVKFQVPRFPKVTTEVRQ